MSTAVMEEKAGAETAPAVVAGLRAIYESGRTRPLHYRQRQLEGLQRFLKEREDEIAKALHDDMGRPPFDAYPSEIAPIVAELALTRKKLKSWTRPERVATVM